jgi:hypothetical protein
MHEEWSYPSIVGMLLYLTTNTRPDIAFAVSQVARFASNLTVKQSHPDELRRVGHTNPTKRSYWYTAIIRDCYWS